MKGTCILAKYLSFSGEMPLTELLSLWPHGKGSTEKRRVPNFQFNQVYTCMIFADVCALKTVFSL